MKEIIFYLKQISLEDYNINLNSNFTEKNLKIKKLLEENKLLLKKIEELKKKSFEFEQKAKTDKLTELGNRLSFDEELDISIDEANRDSEKYIEFNPSGFKGFSIMYLDLDNLKQVNDTYGHLIGDEIIVKFGKIIKNNLRKFDRGFRFGGDEFAIILKNTNLKEAQNIANRILEKIRNSLKTKNVFVTSSIGIANYNPLKEVISKKELLNRVDWALYKSKNEGKNRISIFNNNSNNNSKIHSVLSKNKLKS